MTKEDQMNGIDRETRWIERRTQFVEANTSLSKVQSEALAWSNLGFSESGIADQMDVSESTAQKYLEICDLIVGPTETSRHVICHDEEIRDVELSDVAEWPDYAVTLWEKAAERHGDMIPEELDPLV